MNARKFGAYGRKKPDIVKLYGKKIVFAQESACVIWGWRLGINQLQKAYLCRDLLYLILIAEPV
jgi:hypothetical protein